MQTSLSSLLDQVLQISGKDSMAVRLNNAGDQIGVSYGPDKTLAWFHLFIKLFIDNDISTVNHLNSNAQHEDDEDDILYFVPLEGPSLITRNENRQKSAIGEAIIVRRKVKNSSSLPRLESLVNWKESVYLNMIVQMPFILRVSTCKVQGKNNENLKLGVIRQVTTRVFASPNHCDVSGSETVLTDDIKRENHEKTKTIGESMNIRSFWDHESEGRNCSRFTFPIIYFGIHDFEGCFGSFAIERDELLCVELATITPPILADEDLERLFHPDRDNLKHNFVPLEHDPDYLVVFQGAVRHSALSKVLSEKLSEKTYTGTILMRGPNGRGHAEVSISDLTLNSPSKKHRFAAQSFWSIVTRNFGSLNQHSDERNFPKPQFSKLLCRLTYVSLHWKNIMADLFEWYDNRLCTKA